MTSDGADEKPPFGMVSRGTGEKRKGHAAPDFGEVLLGRGTFLREKVDDVGIGDRLSQARSLGRDQGLGGKRRIGRLRIRLAERGDLDDLVLDLLADALGVKNDASAGLLARFPDVLVPRQAAVDEEQLWADVSDVAAQALQNFVEMRGVEGEKMLEDITARLDTVESCVGRIEALTAGRVEKYTQRLYERLKVILEDRSIDDARVLTEAAIFGDKTAVDEETVRLHSHIAQYREILGGGQPVGRKLDFLTQELNREANTIGSKCQDLDITRIVVDMKAEIEKIREQIQNLE